MAECRRNFIIFLITILCIEAYSIGIAEPNSPKNAEVIAAQTAPDGNCNNAFQLDTENPWKLSESAENKELFSSAAKAIIIVIILCVAIIFISKKLLPKISNLAGRRIQIIETIHLAPRKSLHLIKVDDRQLLIASANENITKLAELTDILNNPFESQIGDVEENNDQAKN